MARDGDLAEGHVPEEGRFSDTVATDETVTASVGESELGVGEDPVRAERDVDRGEVDILRLALGGAGLKGIDLWRRGESECSPAIQRIAVVKPS
jgi:hypothetical protein